jgi:hypothetical protein
MKAVCHYCKDKKVAEQSNNLCVECFNAIVTHYAQQKPAQDHYLETLLMGLKPEPLQKLYTKALTKPYLDYCESVIQFYEKGRNDGQPRIKTAKDRISGDSRTNTNRRGSSPHIRNNTQHISRDQTQKRDIIQAGY